MRIARSHQRVVPRARPAAWAATRYDFVRAHHEGAAAIAALAAGSGIGLLVLATRLFVA
ncbi:hypothetical protein [Methylorubrum zatmanii]|uniref:Uncharacterized protein n=1 Tax=Methylorubrum zatmanii TaxID=29429 RepID=A0ABW1WID0_9HYPH|nr:hypothetical protein [Methylorubrum zatmanii]